MKKQGWGWFLLSPESRVMHPFSDIHVRWFQSEMSPRFELYIADGSSDWEGTQSHIVTGVMNVNEVDNLLVHPCFSPEMNENK